jgi:hypothetical protein
VCVCVFFEVLLIGEDKSGVAVVDALFFEALASVVVSPEAGSTEGAAVVASAAVGYDAAPSVVPIVRGNHFFSLQF